MSEKNDIEKFNNFIFHLEEIVQNFIKRLALEGFYLDYSKESIGILEEYILDKNVTTESNDYYDASCYLGQLFINLYGGNWKLDYNAKSVFYNKPIIDYNSPNEVVFSPFTTIRAIILRKNRNMLQSIIESNVNPKNIEIDW